MAGSGGTLQKPALRNARANSCAPCKRTVGLRWFARQQFPPHGSPSEKMGQPGDRKLTHKPLTKSCANGAVLLRAPQGAKIHAKFGA